MRLHKFYNAAGGKTGRQCRTIETPDGHCFARLGRAIFKSLVAVDPRLTGPSERAWRGLEGPFRGPPWRLSGQLATYPQPPRPETVPVIN